ncbi:MAG: DMT family transporter [Acidobacteriota bacterium]
MPKHPETVARLQIVGAALLFSTGGVAIKACGLNAWQVACFRSGVAALALLVALPEARRRWPPAMLARILAVGACYGATMICFVNANKLTTAANTIYLQATSPLYLLVLAPLLLRERLRRHDLLFMGAMAVGMLFLLSGDTASSATAPDPARGNLFAFASGVLWAFTVVGLRGMSRLGPGGAEATAIAGNVIACLACLPLALPVHGTRPADWAVIAYLGVFQIGLAYGWLTRALRHVPAFEASLLLLVEPVFNPLWVWLVQGERPGHLALAGGLVILIATGLHAWQTQRVGTPG